MFTEIQDLTTKKELIEAAFSLRAATSYILQGSKLVVCC
jgi:hypothetical protein